MLKMTLFVNNNKEKYNVCYRLMTSDELCKYCKLIII